MDEELKQFLSDMEARMRKEIHDLIHDSLKIEVNSLSNDVNRIQREFEGLKQSFDSLEHSVSSLETTVSRFINKVSPTDTNKPDSKTTHQRITLLDEPINKIKIPMAISTKKALERHQKVMERLKRRFDL